MLYILADTSVVGKSVCFCNNALLSFVVPGLGMIQL